MSQTITAVRLDPGQDSGEIRISTVRLQDALGKSVHEWQFVSKTNAAAGK